MFYSLTILTLLASILFYSFYPRNDGIKTQDIPDAKVYATEMLAHHMAAVEAARVVSYDPSTGRNRMAYEGWYNGEAVNIRDYSAYLPAGFINNRSGEDEEMAPTLYCLDNRDGTTLLSTCGKRKANFDPDNPASGSNDYGSSDYIVTFVTKDIGRFDARALGEKVFLTEHSPEAHLRTECGVLAVVDGIGQPDEDFDYQGTCIIDNTRYSTVVLPRKFVCTDDGDGGRRGQLVCITQLSAAYNGTKKVHPQ